MIKILVILNLLKIIYLSSKYIYIYVEIITYLNQREILELFKYLFNWILSYYIYAISHTNILLHNHRINLQRLIKTIFLDEVWRECFLCIPCIFIHNINYII